jgi:hypothetical protein
MRTQHLQQIPAALEQQICCNSQHAQASEQPVKSKEGYIPDAA